MIGRSCKRREALRRAVLIGRALPREGARAPAARGPPAWAPSSLPDRHAAPRVGPRGRKPSGQSRARRGRGRGGRDHPNPFRTRQLSLPSPKVLRRRPWEDRAPRPRRAHDGGPRGPPPLSQGASRPPSFFRPGLRAGFYLRGAARIFRTFLCAVPPAVLVSLCRPGRFDAVFTYR